MQAGKKAPLDNAKRTKAKAAAAVEPNPSMQPSASSGDSDSGSDSDVDPGGMAVDTTEGGRTDDVADGGHRTEEEKRTRLPPEAGVGNPSSAQERPKRPRRPKAAAAVAAAAAAAAAGGDYGYSSHSGGSWNGIDAEEGVMNPSHMPAPKLGLYRREKKPKAADAVATAAAAAATHIDSPDPGDVAGGVEGGRPQRWKRHKAAAVIITAAGDSPHPGSEAGGAEDGLTNDVAVGGRRSQRQKRPRLPPAAAIIGEGPDPGGSEDGPEEDEGVGSLSSPPAQERPQKTKRASVSTHATAAAAVSNRGEPDAGGAAGGAEDGLRKDVAVGGRRSQRQKAAGESAGPTSPPPVGIRALRNGRSSVKVTTYEQLVTLARKGLLPEVVVNSENCSRTQLDSATVKRALKAADLLERETNDVTEAWANDTFLACAAVLWWETARAHKQDVLPLEPQIVTKAMSTGSLQFPSRPKNRKANHYPATKGPGQYRRWLVPVNTGNAHWWLLVVDIQARVMTVYDSFKTAPSRAHSRVTSLVTTYFMPVIDQAAWKVRYPQDVPRQEDAQSCGYYVAEFGRRLCTGQSVGGQQVLPGEVVQTVLSMMLGFNVRKFGA
ncbi:hypothetical protein PLESTM_000942900 [Pleodorina starrii]|nr:hypothetical protein PLESTM_000942900 [Pleodorina starrii]